MAKPPGGRGPGRPRRRVTSGSTTLPEPLEVLGSESIKSNPGRKGPGGPKFKRATTDGSSFAISSSFTPIFAIGKQPSSFRRGPSASSPKFKRQVTKPVSTTIEPRLTVTASAVTTFVGDVTESVEGTFTYDPVPPLAAVTIDGTPYVIRRGSIDVHEVEGTAPNTCNFRVQGTAPVEEQVVIMTLGGELFFAGTIQRVLQAFEEIVTQLVWSVQAIDWTATLNRRYPLGSYVDVSATTVVLDLATRYAPAGFTTTAVQAGLPNVTVVFDGTQTFMQCLETIKNQLGGAKCKVDYSKVIHFYLAEASANPDQLNNTVNTTLVRDPQLTSERDTSQLRNRVYVKGAGTTVAAIVPAGATSIPLTDSRLLPASGSAIVNGQVVTWGAKSTPLVAARDFPLRAPTIAQAASISMKYPAGNYQVRVVFVYPDGHRSQAGPASATVALDGQHDINVTNIPVMGPGIFRELYLDNAVAPATDPDWEDPVDLLELIENDSSTSAIASVEVTHSGNFAVKVDTFIGQQRSGINFTEGPPGSWTSDSIPGPVSIEVRQFFGPDISIDGKIYSVGTLPSGFTTKNVPGINGQVVYFYPVEDFFATDPSYTWTISVDGFPAVDHPYSGNVDGIFERVDPPPSILLCATAQAIVHVSWQGNFGSKFGTNDFTGAIGGAFDLIVAKTILPKGEYKRGATKIKVEPPAGKQITEIFCATGGFATVDGQQISYTSVDPLTNELLGIPATGPGSIGCDHTGEDECGFKPFDSMPSDQEPSVIGPGSDGNGSLTLNSPTTGEIPAGLPINIFVQRDDLESQTQWNVREAPVISDDSITTIEAANARGDAELEIFSQPIVTVNYSSRDRKTQPGKMIDCQLTDPPLVGSFLIQDVTITQVDEADNLQPLYRVRASSVKFTLDDLLRRIALR